MLKHSQPQHIKRVVILGAQGFVGSTLNRFLTTSGIDTLPLGRKQIDLLAKTAAAELEQKLNSDDTLVIISAQAPCKNHSMLLNNIKMMQHICTAIEAQPVKHIIYISSDAVYADSNTPLNEKSITAPDSLHGIMHLARELMLKSMVKGIPLAILRPTLLYGATDPHNGYGPNQFRRLVNEKTDITLFGEGEEQRDHVYIEDVANIITRTIQHQSQGILNIVSGNVTSFKKIAEMTNELYGKPINIVTQPRTMPMPHNGYRAFSIAACQTAFPDFKYTSLQKGLAKIYQQENTKVEV